MFPVISFASAGAVGFGQKKPVTGSIRNSPSRMRKIAATSAIKRIRRHDAGRLNPIADQLPSRSRIEINPITQRTITSFGTMWKTLCPITMKAPKQNSKALSARDARGLLEGNGTLDDMNIEEPPRSTPPVKVMFRPRPDADEPGGNLSQNWKPFQQTKHDRQ